jgi:hypothetical protein
MDWLSECGAFLLSLARESPTIAAKFGLQLNRFSQ